MPYRSKPLYHEGVRSKEQILETIPEHEQLADTDTAEQKIAKGYTLMQCNCAPYKPKPTCDRLCQYYKKFFKIADIYKRRHEINCAVVCSIIRFLLPSAGRQLTREYSGSSVTASTSNER